MANSNGTETAKIPTASMDKVREYAKKSSPALTITETLVIAISNLPSPDRVFKVHDKIKFHKKRYVCIAADDYIATFAPTIGRKTMFKDMIAVPNDPSVMEGFDFSRI
jgi:hypothetical protein